MIITTNKGIARIAADAILEQSSKLIESMENCSWDEKHARPLRFQEFTRIGDYFLCGPSRHPPKGPIYVPENGLRDGKDYQGQLFIGRNLITLQNVTGVPNRIEEDSSRSYVFSRGDIETVLPIFGKDPRLRNHIVASMLEMFRERFNVTYNDGTSLYDRFIVYESPVEKQLVQCILEGEEGENRK